MEKQAVIAPGITPGIRETEKCSCDCGCGKKQKKLPFKEAVAQLEDDAISRMAKIASVK